MIQDSCSNLWRFESSREHVFPLAIGRSLGGLGETVVCVSDLEGWIYLWSELASFGLCDLETNELL